MRIKSLYYTSFETPVMEEYLKFSELFGLHLAENANGKAYFRTDGCDAFSLQVAESCEKKFVGMGFLVESANDLDEAVRDFGAIAISDADRPGGGKAVVLTDPAGNRIELLHGVEQRSRTPSPPALEINNPEQIVRVARSQRPRPLGPPQLYRLGHIGIYVQDFDLVLNWYRDVLGLRVSDIAHAGDPNFDVLAFMRLDKGDTPTEHHSLAIVRKDRNDCHHISFEAQDYETQFMAHRWLQQHGHENCAGVGRHPLGSHVFDTWFGPDGYRWETYSDTDVFDAAHPAAHHDVHALELDKWSDDPTEPYFA